MILGLLLRSKNGDFASYICQKSGFLTICFQDASKTLPRPLQGGPRRPQDGRKTRQRRPKTPQAAPRLLQDGPSRAQDASQMLPRRSKNLKDASKTPQDTPKDASRRSKDASKAPQHTWKTPQYTSKRHQDAYERPPTFLPSNSKRKTTCYLIVGENLQLDTAFTFVYSIRSTWSPVHTDGRSACC